MKFIKTTIALALALLLAALCPLAASAANVKTAYADGSLFLRSGPGTNYKAAGTVHNGDAITVVSRGDIWSKVQTWEGKTGYIKNLYILDDNERYAAGTTYFDARYQARTTARLNLRAGASTGTKIITTLAKGAKLTVLGKNGNFYLVETGGGTQGYVSGSYISKVSGGGTSSSGGTSSADAKVMTVTGGHVNLRAGGGRSYKVLRVLAKGDMVIALKRGNYWTQVRYGDVTGWIRNTYLK